MSEVLDRRLCKQTYLQVAVQPLKMMPPPGNVSSHHSFLGSVQFKASSCPTWLQSLKHYKKGISWSWGAEEHKGFQKLKDLDTFLVHFNPTLAIGISCDASEVGLGAVPLVQQ